MGKKKLRRGEIRKHVLFLRLKRFSIGLEKNLSKSETWFRELYKKNSFEDENDRYNQPFKRFIPDVINKRFKYVIEVDGSFHDLPHQKAKDRNKDQLYRTHRFKIFRVKAYDLASFLSSCREIQLIKMRQKNQITDDLT